MVKGAYVEKRKTYRQDSTDTTAQSALVDTQPDNSNGFTAGQCWLLL
jgi:hypothetical protein